MYLFAVCLTVRRPRETKSPSYASFVPLPPTWPGKLLRDDPDRRLGRPCANDRAAGRLVPERMHGGTRHCAADPAHGVKDALALELPDSSSLLPGLMLRKRGGRGVQRVNGAGNCADRLSEHFREEARLGTCGDSPAERDVLIHVVSRSGS